MHPPGIDIHPRANAVRDLFAVCFVGVPQRHLAREDQVRRQAGVRVR